MLDWAGIQTAYLTMWKSEKYLWLFLYQKFEFEVEEMDLKMLDLQI